MDRKGPLLVLIAGGLPAGSTEADEVKVSHCYRGDTVAAIREGRQKMLAHPRVDMQPATP